MEECNQILSQGIINRVISNQDETIQQNFIKWLKKATYEDIKKERERGFKFKFTIPIKGVPVPFDLGGSDAEEKFTQLKEHINSGEVEEMSMTRTSEFLRENISTEIVSAWENTMAKVLNHCNIHDSTIPKEPRDIHSNGTEEGTTELQPQLQPKYGLQYELNGSGEIITIKIHYIPAGGGDTYPIVESFRVIGGECISGQLKPGTEISDEKLITVKQTSIGDAVLLISTNKQDLDIKFNSNILEPLLVKIFIYQMPLTPSNHIYTKKVPKGYKIIGGGFNVGFAQGEFGQPNCIITSSYPSSLDEWTIKFTSKIEDSEIDSHPTLYLSLTTIYDSHNQWEVRIFGKETRRKTSFECSHDEGYLMVGGGVEFKILGTNGESELLNKEDYRTGLIGNYPKDDHTWEVKLNEVDLERIGTWDLVSYVIAIKNNGSIENHVKIQEHSKEVKLDDRIFYITAGGSVVNNSTNTYIAYSMHDINLQGSPNDMSIPTGWSSNTTFRNGFLADMSTMVIGIRNADILFLPLEH